MLPKIGKSIKTISEVNSKGWLLLLFHFLGPNKTAQVHAIIKLRIPDFLL